MYRCATRTPSVTRTGTYGPDRATLRGCSGLHLILYSIHNISTDQRLAMSHSNTPVVRNRAPLSARSSSLWCVSASERHTAEQFSKTGRTKPRKYLPRSDQSWNSRHGNSDAIEFHNSHQSGGVSITDQIIL